MTMPNFCINFLNKAEKSLPILYDFAVASLADAWIKIKRRLTNMGEEDRSHPSRMRGLKYICIIWLTIMIRSHPSRMRGLKLK